MKLLDALEQIAQMLGLPLVDELGATVGRVSGPVPGAQVDIVQLMKIPHVSSAGSRQVKSAAPSSGHCPLIPIHVHEMDTPCSSS